MLAMTVPDSPALTCPCFLLQQAVHHPTLPVLAGGCPLRKGRRVLRPDSWSGYGRWGLGGEWVSRGIQGRDGRR